jgi:hypothetical protein
MATGAVLRNGVGVARSACGKATGDGTVLSVTLGYMPHRVQVLNMTDGTETLFIDGMAANTTLKRAASGAQTVATDAAITLMEKGFLVNAATNAAGKLLVWYVD